MPPLLKTYQQLTEQTAPITGNELIALAGPNPGEILGVVTVADLLGAVSNGVQLAISSNYTVTTDDRNSTLLVNDVSVGTLTITLPEIDDFGVGNEISVHISRNNGVVNDSGLYRTFINVASGSGDRIGDDELIFDVTGISNNGSGLINVSVEENRCWSIGNTQPNVIISGVASNTNANGTWVANRPITNEETAMLNIVLSGSTYANSAGAGGTARFIRSFLMLQYPTSKVKLRAWRDPNGVNRWLIVSGTIDTAGRSDMGFGDNQAYAPLAYAGQGAAYGDRQPIRDAAYDQTALRWFSRSFMAGEADDPPELGLWRYDMNEAEDVGVYPDGPGYSSSPADSTVGLIWGAGSRSGGYIPGRLAQAVMRTTEAITSSQRGGAWVFSAVAPGTTTMTDLLWIRERIAMFSRANNGYFEVIHNPADNLVFLRNTNASETHLIRGLMASSGSSTKDFLRFESNGGADIEFRLTNAGNGLCDGSWTGGGADYAEAFEWYDGNPDGKDQRAGYSVVLVDAEGSPFVRGSAGKAYIRIATDKDDPSKIIGAVSVNPVVRGGGGEMRHVEKYVTDPLGRVVMEDAPYLQWSVYSVRSDARRKVDVDPGYSTEKQVYGCFADQVPAGMTVPEGDGSDFDTVLRERSERYTDIRERSRKGGVSAEELAELRSLREWSWTSTPEKTVAKRRKVNPNFDPEQEYVPRSERQEWDYIGLLGQVPVYAGQPVNPNWTYLGERAEGVDLWLVK